MDEDPPPDTGPPREGTLPRPLLPGRPHLVTCWEAAWREARDSAENRRAPASLFEAAFEPFWRRYAQGALPEPPLHALDAYYAAQSEKGALPGVLEGAGGDPGFPGGFAPPIASWAEWDHVEHTGDESRLARVFPLLVRHLNAYLKARSRANGAMWGHPGETALPDIPRPEAVEYADLTAQATLDCECLALMAIQLGHMGAANKISNRYLELKELLNTRFWDRTLEAHADRDKDGDSTGVLHLGSYWALMAALTTRGQAAALRHHLGEFSRFRRHHGLPALPATEKGYKPRGDSTAGGVLPPLVYMVARALERADDAALAHEIALRHVEQVAAVHGREGAFFERYAPDFPDPGTGARRTSPGPAALAAISLLVEFVLGIRLDVPGECILWRLFLDEEHGIENLRHGASALNLHATFDRGSWSIEAHCGSDVELIIMGPAASRIIALRGGKTERISFHG